MRQRKFDSRIVELPSGGSDGVLNSDGLNFHDLNLSV